MITKYVNFKWGFTGETQQMEVRNGRVVSRTPAAPLTSETNVVDLEGQYVIPAFIDAHCHILPTGLDLKKLHLGNAQSRADVLEMVRNFHSNNPNGWLLAVHYNQTKYENGEHLTRYDLDKISKDRPILLEHVNGHACVVNSAALVAAKVNDSTPDPAGGSYRRDADGRIDGVLLERAHEYVVRCAPMATVEEMADAIVAAGQKMSELGITCASDMSTGFFDIEREIQAYRLAAERGCSIYMRLYLQWSSVFGPKAISQERFSALLGDLKSQPSVRVDGIKIFADGGISSATAAIYGSFCTKDNGGEPQMANGRPVDGQLIYKPERLNKMVRTAHDAGYKVSVHSIGDYSTDLVLDAISMTGEGSRHRIEHAMMLSDSQIDRMREVGCYCATQPEFLLRLGPAYLRQLGPERTSMLIRSRSMIDAGIPLSFNSDRPIVAGDPWDGIRTAAHRPEGFDPVENCTVTEGLLAYTAEAAKVNGDEGLMGTLNPGELAHFQVYKKDPLNGVEPGHNFQRLIH